MLPFVALIALLGVSSAFPPLTAYPVRAVCLGIALWLSRGAIRMRPRAWAASLLLGVAVFVLWVGPDLVWPGYRDHWWFHNALTGATGSGAPLVGRTNSVFLAFRVIGSVLLVPVAEELFWRAWLMRRLIDRDFEKVPLGSYEPFAFWATALLFAVEHGEFWGVGVLAGIAYGWWIVRTRSLADAIFAHAITNACVAVWVLTTGKWEYWM